MIQLPLNIYLDDSAKFSNYFCASNNQLIEQLKSLSSEKNKFIFIWGSPQSGKSHLAQAICHEVSNENKTAAYIPLDNLSLRPEVLNGLEFADLVCLDGLEAVSGVKEWEEALFNLFNTLKHHKRQLIVFSQQLPKNCGVNLADLCSRLMSMEVYKLQTLTDDEQLDFVIENGKYRGLDIPVDVAQFLLVRTDRAVNNLVELVKQLDRQSLAHQRKITIPFVKNILKI